MPFLKEKEELYTPVKKRQGKDKSCHKTHSRTANVNVKMNREINLGSVIAFQLVDLLQYFRNHKVTETLTLLAHFGTVIRLHR